MVSLYVDTYYFPENGGMDPCMLPAKYPTSSMKPNSNEAIAPPHDQTSY